MQVSNRALQTLADALRHRRTVLGSRWRRLPAGRQALLVLAHLNKGETYTALAGGFGVGTTTVFRYVREGVDDHNAIPTTLSANGQVGTADMCRMTWNGVAAILAGEGGHNASPPGPQIGRLQLTRVLGQGYQVAGFTPC
jgi:hypothetical protein